MSKPLWNDWITLATLLFEMAGKAFEFRLVMAVSEPVVPGRDVALLTLPQGCSTVSLIRSFPENGQKSVGLSRNTKISRSKVSSNVVV
jgi:hypothetical protein